MTTDGRAEAAIGPAGRRRNRIVATPLWYKDAIVYEVPVRSFNDSNRDGVGDFPGLLEKLDYLSDLGVTCLWLQPFFPSPMRDDGFDISAHCDVHPVYGTLDDFQRLVEAAHERRLEVLIELVLNHTSDQHPWFQRARTAPRSSVERDFYVWSDTDQKYQDARIILPEAERSNWSWDPLAEAYYWHRFFHYEPDLNYENPAVLEEIEHVLDFWLELGVDGFRLDALPYLAERDGSSCEDLPETHAIVRAIRRHVESVAPNALLLAEATQRPAHARAYFGDGDECQMTHHFPLMARIFMALHVEDRGPIIDIMQQTPEIPDICQWALFLRNHDELTPAMLTDEEREYMFLAYSMAPHPGPGAGVRRRLAPLMGNDRRRIELLVSLLFSFRGTPIIYYGDEIGMGDNLYLGGRRAVRTPMQWTSDRNGGFSRADPERLYSPVITDAVYGYQAVNVEAQESDTASLLHWMKNMIALRKLFKVFGRGTVEFLDPLNRKVLAYVRQYGDDVILCVANLSRFVQPVELDLRAYAGFSPVEMLGYSEFPSIGERPYFLTVGPYGFQWYELKRPGR
jgi:maltose alpha-D-glucosyltransferase/alpha-amylase